MRFGETYPNAFRSAGIGGPYSSAFKSAGTGLFFISAGIGHSHSLMRMTYPRAFKSAGTGLSHSLIRMTYPSAFGLPIPAFLKNAVIGLLW